MALTLAVRCDDAGELPAITFDMPRLIIGRGEGCDLRLPDPSVSQHHASLRQRGSDYIIVDEGSTNGTFVGPVRLAPQAPRVLRSGDRIRVGRIWIEVRIESVVVTTNHQHATRDLALQMVAKSLAAGGEAAIPQLKVIEGQDAGTELILDELDRRYVLGRSATADLVLLDTNASRRHVEVRRQGAQVMLRDLGSKNGSKLDSTYLLPDKEIVWPEGAVLGIGLERIALDDPTRAALAEMSDAADDHLSELEQSELASISPAPPSADSNLNSTVGAGDPSLPTNRTRPKRKAKSSQSRSGRVTSADMSVVILALAVLAASLLGLLWMLGGK
jgi:pSer/pThr/pTyr-binding forkhead associated (FHA) protein